MASGTVCRPDRIGSGERSGGAIAAASGSGSGDRQPLGILSLHPRTEVSLVPTRHVHTLSMEVGFSTRITAEG